jgi:putative endonuclease
MLSNKKIVPHSGDPSSGYAAFRMTCWGDTEKQYCVYILASKKYGTLYTGITSNLAQRMYQHQEGLVDGFTKKYDVHQLVYYEVHLDVYEAITREKQIKKWNRQWKINLIEQNNPQWLNLANGLF